MSDGLKKGAPGGDERTETNFPERPDGPQKELTKRTYPATESETRAPRQDKIKAPHIRFQDERGRKAICCFWEVRISHGSGSKTAEHDRSLYAYEQSNACPISGEAAGPHSIEF